MGSLARCKRRAQGWQEQDVAHEKEDLRSLSAPLSIFAGSSFRACAMGLSDLTGAALSRTIFQNCQLPLLRAGAARFDFVTMADCDLEQAAFAGSVLRNVSFLKCRLSYSSFVGATLRNVVFEDCDLKGADLDFVESNAVHFDGDCNLWGVKAAFNCQFFNATFEEKALRRLVAMVARKFPEGYDRAALVKIAGRHFGAVDRLMKPRKEVA